MLQSLFHVILLLLMKPKRCVTWVWLVINMQQSCPINGWRAWLSPHGEDYPPNLNVKKHVQFTTMAFPNFVELAIWSTL